MGFLDKITGVRWGVHPHDDHKRPAADVPLRVMPIPATLCVPLLQHVGAPAKPVVAVGDKVLRGQLLASAQGNVSAPVHAPTSGVVTAIGAVTAPHPSGLSFDAISIACDGEDLAVATSEMPDPLSLAPDEVTRQIAAAGIVGLGGATFPSAPKAQLGRKHAVETLIINGGECEPYLSSDDCVMRARAEEVVDGIRILMHATGAASALVGIEDNKPEAIAAMRAAAKPFDAIRICPVPARYPMGSDRQLVEVLTGKQVPAGARTATVGVLVNNVSTCAAIHRALRHGESLYRRIVTVNGGAVMDPGNVLAPIGVMVEDLLAFVGLKETPARLVMGGPMMGAALPHARVPTVKGCGGILALSAAEIAKPEPSPCIRCGSCVSACPMGLLPLEIAARVKAGDYDGADAQKLDDCLACGCCAYVCPSHLPLVHAFYHAKGELWKRAQQKKRNEFTKGLAQARTARLEREARERAEAAARRKAERAAQQAAQAAAAAE
ncbi:electron transport complex subunit RsxC [Uliginosibacterium sp. 31-12]|uniref:electron transport complex subunit RsxC n=1 Tax=Uliginosibacterium sp. 31-12 TaxID=3062781 RepID=UPI0026E116F7|nr:electron transport complex subunit RsxC [Uliginosibacterium sp. 31-12]MDO6388043.1 electron transport complex subunit RsxC [Uliginosibacterium sp. 31-12]